MFIRFLVNDDGEAPLFGSENSIRQGQRLSAVIKYFTWHLAVQLSKKGPYREIWAFLMP